MTNIEALRARKRELLARKKYELDLQARGEGDNLALFMVSEELLDINDQLRALTAGRWKRGENTPADYAKDRQQYLDWRREQTALDGETDEGRARLKAAAVQGLDLLTPRQREMLERYLSGRNIPEIAGDLGVNKSTVSRTIALAKKKLREETERAMTEAKLRGESARVDLQDPAAARAVLLALTPKQTVYFYLYYSECLTLREIGELAGTDHATISRTLRRALRNIGTLLGGQDTILENPEALDELAWQAYCELEDHPELVPEGVPPPRPYRPPERRGHSARSHILPKSPATVTVRRGRGKPPGKLLEALLARREDQPKGFIFQWLEAVFAAFRQRLKTRGALTAPCNFRPRSG
nr:sigma factor-like helix-turn-helix DNA-binding protein [uncultured Oscillibacter sp.]